MDAPPEIIIAVRRHGFVTVAGSTAPYLLTSAVVLASENGADRWLVKVGRVCGRCQEVAERATREEAIAFLASVPAPPVESRGALLDEVEIETSHLPRPPRVVGKYDTRRGWRGGASRDACDRCGSGVRRVTVVEDAYGRQRHLGADCALRVLSGR